MDKTKFAREMIELLCNYSGDDKVFEAFIKRWGIEELYTILNEIVELKDQVQEVENKDGDENGEFDDDEVVF